MDLGDRAAQFRFLVRDRAGQFTASLDALLADAGIAAVQIPPRSPRANAFAERFVFTVRTEVSDRMLIFGERHLRAVLTEYARHYNRRPHRARHLHPPQPDPVTDISTERVKVGFVEQFVCVQRSAQSTADQRFQPHCGDAVGGFLGGQVAGREDVPGGQRAAGD
jgi:Integrase core domain